MIMGKNKTKLDLRIMLLLFIISFCGFTAFSYYVINQTKVNGSIHSKISRGQNLVADILPPPGYIIETHFYNSEIVNAKSKIDEEKYFKAINKFESQYNHSKKEWKKSTPEIQAKFSESDIYVKEYFYLSKTDLFNSLSSETKHEIYQKMNTLFLKHRACILDVVKIQKKINATITEDAEKSISRTLFFMIIIALFLITSVTITTIYLGNRVGFYSARLRGLMQEQDKFYSIIAHDLRGPIWNVSAMLSLLNEGGLDAEEEKELLKALENQSESTAVLLDNLLEWTKLHNGIITADIKTVNIADVVNESLSVLIESANLKNIKLWKEIVDCEVDIDRRMIATALRNLVSNSLKFTYPHGEIKISTEIIDHLLIVKIKDNGMGIPKEKLDKIFNINGVNSTKGTGGEIGSGLGLKICEELVKRNNGRFFIESTVDVGTEVRIEFEIKKNLV